MLERRRVGRRMKNMGYNEYFIGTYRLLQEFIIFSFVGL